MTITDEMVIAARKAYMRHEGDAVSALRAALTAALATVPGDRKPDAWIGYWPGAGSIDSITRTTRWERTAEEWRSAGAEITPLYARLATVPGESGVKGLVWAVNSMDYFGREDSWVTTSMIDYLITLRKEVYEPFVFGRNPLGKFVTLTDAKAAAQADFEQRIRSALQPQPSAPAGGEVAELIEAAQALYDKIIGAGTTVTYVDEERLGKALANLKARSGE